METQPITLTRHVSYAARYVENPKGLLLLIHGYLQNGQDIFNLLMPYLPHDWTVIAPNAIFPVAHRHKANLRLAFTWYLFDPTSNQYLIDMDQACEYLREFISHHQQPGQALRVVGYSQGGYLAPVAAQYLSEVEQVVGINCRFREEVLPHPLPFPIHAIHGQDDVLVDPKRARQCHNALIQRGNRGHFEEVPHAGHRINGSLGHALTRLLARSR